MHHPTDRPLLHQSLAGTSNSSMCPPWRIDPTTHRTMSKRFLPRNYISLLNSHSIEIGYLPAWWVFGSWPLLNDAVEVWDRELGTYGTPCYKPVLKNNGPCIQLLSYSQKTDNSLKKKIGPKTSKTASILKEIETNKDKKRMLFNAIYLYCVRPLILRSEM